MISEHRKQPCKHGGGVIGPIIDGKRYRVCLKCGWTWYDDFPPKVQSSVTTRKVDKCT